MTKNNKEKTIINSLAGVMADHHHPCNLCSGDSASDRRRRRKRIRRLHRQCSRFNRSKRSEKSQPQPVQQEASAVQFELPQEMKAAQVSPGREFLSELCTCD